MTEALNGDYTTAIVCVDPTTNSSGANRVATINVAPGETVTCTYTKDTLRPGTVTIIKNADPDVDTNFTFDPSAGINAGADFFLDDDTDATLSNTATFPVAPGIHTVTEALNGDYTTAIVCVDPTTNSSGANRVATINVAPGETVTCTYTNTLRPGTVTIIKDADPNAETDFSFDPSTGINSDTVFVLDYDPASLTPSTLSFPVAPGQHSVTEALNTNYTTTIDCDDANSTGTARVATINVEPGETVECTYTNTNVPPRVTIDKTALTESLPEPGGSFTYQAVITNTSAETVTITSLVDAPYGNLATLLPASTCGALVGTQLIAGQAVTCTFVADFFGNAGENQPDVLTVVVTDSDGATGTDDDDAVVGISGVDPTVTVLKTADPSSLPEPGGDFPFTVVVTNTSAEDVTITELSDSIYNLADNGTCHLLIGRVLDPGQSVSCTFTGNFTGNAGDSETDVVTVVVIDDDGESADDEDDATVTLTNVPPTVTVQKTASPSSLPEPGGNSTYTVVITNTSAEDVTITSLTDSIYDLATVDGNCDDLLGDTLAAGASVSCTFTGNFSGNAGESETDTVRVVVTDDDDTTATDEDDAAVTLTDVAPTLTVVKTASPSSLPAPGGNFTYTVVITNTSAEAVTITSLTDSIYNLATVAGNCDDLVGDILAAGASVTCTFTGNFTGTDGDTETDVVTVVVTDDDGTRATQIDDATVNLGPAPLAVEIAGETIVLAPAPAVLPAVELPRTGSRELQRQVLLALGLVLAGATFRLVNRRRRFNSA